MGRRTGVDAEQVGCKTGGTQDRRADAGQVGCKTGGLEDRGRCRTGRMQDRWDARLKGSRMGGNLDRWNARLKGCRMGGNLDRWDARLREGGNVWRDKGCGGTHKSKSFDACSKTKFFAWTVDTQPEPMCSVYWKLVFKNMHVWG